MKKVCVVTAARSEYGLLRWLLEELNNSEETELQIIVTGSHLSIDHGLTYKEIEKDGFTINKKIEILLSTATSVGIAKSMGLCSISIADALLDLSPDLLIVLGDRYELLPICSTALVMQIPIAHISGGDVTVGAIDDQVRNAVTMMSSLHFPGTEDSSKRIARMIGCNNNIYMVGEPGLENFIRLRLINRKNLSNLLELDIHKKWFLLTFHPETKESLSTNLLLAKNIIEALREIDNIQVIITYANADLGGIEINAYFREIAQQTPIIFKQYPSLGQLKYLSLMKESACIIGNSSSGIVEAPFLGKPVVNIGKRQLGRHICSNVINVSGFNSSIKDALREISLMNCESDHYFGNGKTASQILKYIRQYFLQ